MKKLLSIVLMLALIMSLSIGAYAENGAEPAATESTATMEVTSSNGSTNITTENSDTDDNTVIDSLPEAVDAADNGETIIVIADTVSGGAVLNGDDKNLTIDLNDQILTVGEPTVGSTGTETNGIQILQESEKTEITNGTLVFGEAAKMGIQNYNDLVLTDISIQGHQNTQYVVSNNQGDVLIGEGTEIIAADGQIAFDVCDYATYTGVKVTVDGENIHIVGAVEYSGSKTDPENQNAVLNINDGTFDNFVLIVDPTYADTAANGGININGGKFSFGSSSKEGAVTNAEGLKLYIPSTHEIVADGSYWLVRVYVAPSTPDAEPVEVYVPVPVVSSDVSTSEYAEIEINGNSYSVWIDTGYTRTEDVAPVVAGSDEAAVLGLYIDRDALANIEYDMIEEVLASFVDTAVVSTEDGSAIDADSYEFEFAEDGMINIKLSPEFLKKLGAGKHTIIVNYAGLILEYVVTIL